MALEREIETYNRKLLELRAHEGKWVLIHGETVEDTFSTYEDAVKAGYQKCGLSPFLVKQIHTIEQAQFITRLFDPARPQLA